MMKLLILIRGLPGSGKTTLAHKLSEHVFESDQFFTRVVDGVEQYNFNPKEIQDAHVDCIARTREALIKEYSPVCVANTFTQFWEYSPYLDLAEDRGYTVQILTTCGPWENTHGCPADTITRMRKRWQPEFLTSDAYHKWLLADVQPA